MSTEPANDPEADGSDEPEGQTPSRPVADGQSAASNTASDTVTLMVAGAAGLIVLGLAAFFVIFLIQDSVGDDPAPQNTMAAKAPKAPSRGGAAGGTPSQARGASSRKTRPQKWSDYYRKSHAVIIGINAYSKMPKLKYAVRDAEEVERALKKRGFETTLLLDTQATKTRIEEVLFKTLPEALHKNDRVLVFFAGHGVSKHDMGYLMPADAGADEAAFAGINMGVLQEAFANPSMYPAKHVLYIADACYSGLALSSRGSGVSEDTQGYVKHIVRQKVRVALTAGSDTEEVTEKHGHGLFTLSFLEALDGAADINHDGIITTAELWPYLSREVAQQSKHRQTPQYGRSGTGEFVFKRVDSQ